MQPDNISTKPRRPFSVTLLGWLVLFVAMLNLVRLILSIQFWDFLMSVLPFSPLYLSLSGLVWFCAGLAVAWGVWRGKTWAVPAFWLAALGFVVYYWIDRILLAGYVGRNNNWMFAAGANILIVLWCFWVFSRPRAREFFGIDPRHFLRKPRPDLE
jgi:hypothetical protein